MMPVTVSKDFKVNELANFSLTDRTLTTVGKSTSYLPAIYLPKTVELSIFVGSFLIEFYYGLEETTTEETVGHSILVRQGRNSKRIFGIEAGFSERDVSALFRRLYDVEDVIKDKRSKAQSESLKRNYDLILSLIARIIDRIKNSKKSIEDEVFAS